MSTKKTAAPRDKAKTSAKTERTALPREDETIASYLVPQQIGEGIFYTGKLQPGLSVVYADYRLLPGSVSVREVEYGSDVLFRFRLGGKSTIKYHDHEDVFEFQPGSCGVITTNRPMTGIAREESTGERSVHVMIRCTRPFLREIMPHQSNPLMKGIADKHADRGSDIFYDSRTMPPQTELAIQQMIRCPYEGDLKNLYLHSKALELLALYFSAPFAGRKASSAPMKFSAAEIEAVKAARDIVGTNLTDPPSLEKLAKMVGMRSTKLKLGFHHVFGRSAFNYLRERRMELARKMLAEGQHSIEEVGRMTGFPNASHFTQAFRKHFGFLPKEIKGQKI